MSVTGCLVGLWWMVLLMLAPGASAEPSRVPPNFYGVNAGGALADASPDDRKDAFVEMALNGIDTVRVGVNWQKLQDTEGGEPDWSGGATPVDQIVRTAATHGIRVSLVGMLTPDWALSSEDIALRDRDGNDWIKHNVFFPAVGKEAAWQALWSEMVGRYGPGGTFWDPHDSVPDLPVLEYEVWNEPNYEGFSADGIQPARYGELYRLARAAIHAVAPGVRVVTGGLAPTRTNDPNPNDVNRRKMLAADFLDGLGMTASDPIEGVAIHPYGNTPSDMFWMVREVRDWLDSKGRPDVPLIINEWGAAGPGYAKGGDIGLSEVARAALYGGAADLLSRSDCGIASILPYTWQTARTTSTEKEEWYGIVHSWDLALTDGSGNGPLPAYAARISKQTGLTSGANRQTVPICDRDLPNSDGTGEPDENDYAPHDASINDAPTAGPPVVYELPALRYTGALGEVDRQADGARDRYEVGETVRTGLGAWDGSPAPTRTVIGWEHCAADETGCTAIPGSATPSLHLTSSLLGRHVRSVVQATNVHGTSVARSALSAVIGSSPTVTRLDVYGAMRVGSKVTAVAEAPAVPNAAPTYTFTSCMDTCAELQKGSDHRFTIPPSMVNKRLWVKVSVQNDYGWDAAWWSSPTTVSLL